MKPPRWRPLGGSFLTHGTWLLLAIMGVGYSFGLARFLTGLDGVTNLSDRYPWGIWKAVNVAAGVALAACGFTAAALADIFGRHRYRIILRPALLTAWFGYLMVAVALIFDLGRYWNIWQPLLHWQGNSVLFEVAMCVVAYLVVLTLELSPAILEGLEARASETGRAGRLLAHLRRPLRSVQRQVRVVLPVFIVAGFVLSSMHHSSLGTLMIIAGGKLDPIWQTTLLPVLFLLSAMMVGLPVVIAEILLAARAWHSEPPMDVLADVARLVKWPVAAYLLVKLGDLWLRRQQIDLGADPVSTVVLAIEIVAGVVVPLAMLQFRRVRSSAGHLLLACLLLIGGVVLNRLAVYLIGYRSPVAEIGYTPSFGELALTAALLSTIIVGFRLVATSFPILALDRVDSDRLAERAGGPAEPDAWPTRPRRPRRGVAIAMRSVAALLLLVFVFVYATVHQRALRGQAPVFRGLPVLEREAAVWRQAGRGHPGRPAAYRNFVWLQSAELNQVADYYEPVRFSHRSHDVAAGGDCGVCHHRVSFAAEDRTGQDLAQMHQEMDVLLGGACSNCHEDLGTTTFQPCADCHREPVEPDDPTRPGLKAAYHRQCLGCHERTLAGAAAPTDCRSCHRPLVPDHGRLVRLEPGSSLADVTAECVRCHAREARDLARTAHWNWSGPAPALAGAGHARAPGLLQVVDGYSVSLLPELVDSAPFHVVLPGWSVPWQRRQATGAAGWPSDEATTMPSAMAGMDCLVCHDGTGLHRPDASVPFSTVTDAEPMVLAARVSRPARDNCGSCHFHNGGWANARHGDLEPALAAPDPQLDVHMGGADMLCTDCHLTRNHRVAGMSFGAPVTEGRVRCEQCHGSHPHGITGALGPHLDTHVAAVACQTCHLPSAARGLPTLVARDLSTAGLSEPPPAVEAAVDSLLADRPRWLRSHGSLTWARNVVPAYRWFDGTRSAVLLGEAVSRRDTVDLNAPRGDRRNPAALIHPFKTLVARLPQDTEKGTLLPVDFRSGALERGDWTAALSAGARAAGLSYSGRHGFAVTRTWTSLNHEIPPAREAFGCADCHQPAAVDCQRCHAGLAGQAPPEHAAARYPASGPCLDFSALGYEGDPAQTGGRFQRRAGRGKPQL
jgi:Ni/Fe-hydrogenase subunit HybB-like protein